MSWITQRKEGDLLKIGLNWNKHLCWYFYLKFGRLILYLRVPRKKYKKELGARYHWTFSWDLIRSSELFSFSFDTQTLSVLGVKYSLEFFENIRDPNPNAMYRITRSSDGIVNFEEIPFEKEPSSQFSPTRLT